MTDAKLASELKAISGKLEEICAEERKAAAELDRRFTAEQDAIEALLRSVREVKSDGRWRKTRFNVFDVLGRPRLEGAHSSFLAWLLNPDEAHGLGDLFLRKFMRKAIEEEPPSTTDVSVFAEERIGENQFDIRVKGDRWCLVVENKVDHSAGEDQWKRYEKYCSTLRKLGEKAWLVYVTPPDRQHPSKVPWLSYGDVRLILESLTPAPSAERVIRDFCEHVSSELEA
jgi:hypothetical protein